MFPEVREDYIGRRVALFFTGRKHAGENLQRVLAERASELAAPLHMSDALDRNDPAECQTVRGCCFAHGRRKFVEIADSFPAETRASTRPSSCCR